MAELGLKTKEIKPILMHYFYLAFQQNCRMFTIHVTINLNNGEVIIKKYSFKAISVGANVTFYASMQLCC